MTRQEFNMLLAKKYLTPDEYRILEPYKVKRAVIMAAGLGTRLRPLTYTTPKPLITVNGVRIIDTILDALMEQGINDIYIIRGYLAEQFDVLLDKYPNVHMLNNLAYDQGNNILSACLVGDLLEGAYVMPADILINNPKVFGLYQYSSNVLGYRVNETEDWCIATDDSGVIKRLAPGGKDCFKDTGIFYWDTKDGLQLSKDIMKVCAQKEGWQRYWSNVAFEIYKDNYKSVIRECKESDVIEIDTIEELAKIDSSYERI